MHLRKISLKSENAELEVEREDDKDYLDQYSMELVYCLEQTAKKIGHTVVFEDMDRFNAGGIFERLREVNTLANIQLQKENKKVNSRFAPVYGVVKIVYVQSILPHKIYPIR